MKASDYHDIGRYFKDCRESLKLSVAEAARTMHIRTHYVEALESGDLARLPGKTYIRGYIKNYALFLGLNAAEALEAYDALSGVVKRELYIPEPTVKESLPSRTLLIIAMAAAAFMFCYYMLALKEFQATAPQVAEVPSSLLLQAESIRSKHNEEWMECLESTVNGCFNTKYSGEILSDIQEDYGNALHFLSAL